MLHGPGVDGSGRVRVPPELACPAVTALTGFQSATACSHPGMCCVGTMALETKASGKSTMKPNDAADSGVLLLRPTQAAIQDSE